ncbi:tRNA dihydrouridine synthase DusB [Thiomicrorhabdus sediminis]|uniref:tRNA-dihydrouridine synthase B n=1 Tax=Thiomicrorhabdus sediminis TaxID=2580412 RepID=A0A4P9K6P7_9GAMM|nr:tRNA dihydrouridine synthase DusB [Thiomicrorhabdus sediminis]QCU90742.1 tRNA dihydrouridine synthase DusB [Thiomicrorhabdus sediminis]
MSLQIGPYQFKHNLVLAPMAGITDAVYRQLCRDKGADYTLAEMVASKKQLWDSKKSSTRHASLTDPEPRAVQLIGTDATELAEAAAWQVSQGAQIIDLNMGCPAKKVCNVAAGSALMAMPDKVEEIFQTVVAAVNVPVTVKIRTGSDDSTKNALQIALLAEQCGLQAVTIHGRTRAAKFSGEAEYQTIKEVKQALSIPVIANGDICTPEQADFVLEYTLADGIMLGRATQGYPWIFREINHYLNSGNHLEKPSLEEFAATVKQHISGLHRLYGEDLGLKIARKHLGWYAQHLPDGKQLRRQFNQLQQADLQLDIVYDFFAELGYSKIGIAQQKQK